MSPTIIFSIISASITIGGVLIAIGMLKSKIQQNAETNKAQDEQIKTLASKKDVAAAATHCDEQLAAAIRRSDEMLEIMRQRAEEDRAKGQGQWKEFHALIAKHAERIGVLETQQGTLMKSLDEIKGDIKSGFRQLQDELKELRNLR